MKPRFSLRALLAVFTIAVAFCWWRDRPRRIANRFIAAVKAGDYKVADELFALPDNRFVVAFIRRDERNRIHAQRQPQSSGDWLLGRCPMTVRLEDFDGLGASLQTSTFVTAAGVGLVVVVNSVDGAELMPEVPERASRIN